MAKFRKKPVEVEAFRLVDGLPRAVVSLNVFSMNEKEDMMIREMIERNRCPHCGIVPELIMLGGICIGITATVLWIILA